MSTKKPTSANKKNHNDPSRSSANPKPGKKPKSTGFIENSDFKPNWLETGPLSPDMLPDSNMPDASALTSDEFEALQTSLQRFYIEEGQGGTGTSEEFLQQGELSTDPLEEEASESLVSMAPVLDDEAFEEELSEEEFDEETLDEEFFDEDELEALTEEEYLPPAGSATAVEPPSSGLEELDTAPLHLPTGDETAGHAAESEVPFEDSDDASGDNDPEAVIFRPVAERAEWVMSIPGVGASIDDQTETAALPEVDYSEYEESEEVDDFVEDVEDLIEAPLPDGAPLAAAIAAPAAVESEPKKVKRPKEKKRRDRLAIATFILSLALLGAAALIYFVNPFSRIALGSASLARPVSSPSTPSPAGGSGEWCVRGSFLSDSTASPKLADSGGGGDILAEDRVFSLEYVIPQPGTYEWQVIDCNNPDLAFPESAAWVTTNVANQPVTLNFDSNQRADPLFFPIPYVVSAEDAATKFRVVGNFQDWNVEDVTGELQRINLGIYQQVRRIARAGSYEAYVIAGDENQAIDAYGRATEPIPFAFETDRNGDVVVFLVDTDRGRASVMYDMPPVMTALAFGNGYWILSLVLAGLALLLLAGLLARMLILNNKRLQMETGCPNCGRQELMRISRRPGDRLLHIFGIPAYRYRCRHCTWEGTRLSEKGAPVSPGVELARIDEFR